MAKIALVLVVTLVMVVESLDVNDMEWVKVNRSPEKEMKMNQIFDAEVAKLDAALTKMYANAPQSFNQYTAVHHTNRYVHMCAIQCCHYVASWGGGSVGKISAWYPVANSNTDWIIVFCLDKAL